MRKTLLFLTACTVALTGCGFTSTKEISEREKQRRIYEDIDRLAEEYAATHSSSSESSSASLDERDDTIATMHTVVLVDQSFEAAKNVTGAARLKAMRVMKLGGSIQNATLKFTLSCNGQNEGIAGVTVYSADLDETGNVNPETEWKRFRVVGGSWLGNGNCRFSLENYLVSGKGETVEAEYDMSAFPVSSSQPECDDSIEEIDFVSRMNAAGLAIGFLPTNQSYHLKVELTYEGDLTVNPW